jgi:maleylacetoacetate isomerase
MSKPVLYDYWRSSASYRVRIALNLLKIDYDAVPVDLLAGEHKSEAHLKRNPQGIVPTLEIDGLMLTQSLAMIEYLDETRAGSLMPDQPAERARARMLAHAIAMEIHPVCNLSVVAHVMELSGGGDDERIAWMRKYIGKGLAAFEALLAQRDEVHFCCGERPGIADCCLIPQLYNAGRWNVDVSGLTRIGRIAANCAELDAFAAAHPDRIGPPGG